MTERPTIIQSQTPGTTVLVPIFDQAGSALLRLAAAYAAPQGMEVVALRVVSVPDDQPLSDGVLDSQRLRAELDTLLAELALPAPARAAVAVARSADEGVRAAVTQQQARALLVGWQGDDSSPERLFGPPIDTLLRQPPCDLLVVRLSTNQKCERLLLPVRGGPHTPLACDVAVALAEHYDAAITALYAAFPRLPDDDAVREGLQTLRTLPRLSRWLERTIPPSQAILAEAPDHQLIVLGVSGRRPDSETPVGPLAERVLRQTDATIVLVCHQLSAAEEQRQQLWQRQRDLSAAVDRWFAENTFTSAEFEDIDRLVALKQQQGVTISLGLPALNEEETLGEIIDTIKATLMGAHPLVDELILIDSGSTDRTRQIAEERGVPVHIHQEILPQYGAFYGKGEALWKSLYVLSGDLIAWVDTDIKNFHPRFVYGVLGPLLRDPRLVYSKGFYRRPLQFGESVAASGGGRVTELTARPLLNLFYPELSGMLQPLSGEYAARRSAIEWCSFFTGYGVETGLLIDLLEQHGIGALAQVDLEQRVHRNQELQPLSKMAFAITQVVMQRLEQRQRVQLLEPVNQTMKLITYAEQGGFHLDLREIRDHERPPIASIPEYRKLRGLPPRRN